MARPSDQRHPHDAPHQQEADDSDSGTGSSESDSGTADTESSDWLMEFFEIA
ncbi:hypothetical protein PG22506_0122 [Bifidobacterium pseudolongum subsp. globosum]|uniref:Uncharacterized protein n=1 Tax=Bifidobacterium pseudolongum subsp. globosum TaxID=1690 RepID=A0A2N3QWX1_9BIFI|nr:MULTISPECIES: hypothetical protein [Bifidobacterium]MCI6772815.1 hypothetical protein [Bifidobacterium pseudolongum]MEE1201997.1 hypothetical protein [Bifidobacterium sp.]NLW57884.1 hypothetical protein [Bifidobacterium pseudolongum subsp. globosum]PKU97188.1 hypothetical protein CQR56_0655 [Bifidobacterium pseudolongum subsp. globosum]PKU98508.1 hypothetical protein CQR55_0139 [Bifidobacterium pseudolongum subsp. globosum]